MKSEFNLWDGFVRNAELFPDRAALSFPDARITHAAFLEASRLHAGYLSALGVGRGDRVAVIADTCEQFFFLLAGAARLGSILVPVNWRLNPDEVGRILDDCTPQLVVAEAKFRHLANRGRVVDISDLPAAMADSAADERAAREAETSAALPVLILYTATVDGQPRGATISHANLIASSAQMHLALSFSEQDVFLGNLPFFHMMAIALFLGVNFAGGTTVVRSRFDAPEAADLVDSEAVSLIGTFPPMLGSLLDEREKRGRHFSSLRFCMGLDAATTIERFEKECPGAAFWSIYGQTETTGNVSYGRWRDRPGAAGRAAMLSRLAILDAADRPVADGRIGEIGVRGPGVFLGYWGRDAENQVIGRSGWHHTGDLGRIEPGGWLTYQGRAPHKQLIKTGGENVYPGEVEAVIGQHPMIAHAVVFGVEDARWGESVVAVCEVTKGSQLQPQELSQFLADRIARYKQPKSIMFCEALPRAANGTVDRERARELFRKS